MRAIFSSRSVFLVVLVFGIGWLGLAAGKEFYRRWQLQQEISRVQQEIARLDKENTNLSALIESFNQESTLELEARKRLNMKKPDEEVVIILPSKNSTLANISDDWDEPPVKDMPNNEGSEPSQKDDFVAHIEEWWRFVFE